MSAELVLTHVCWLCDTMLPDGIYICQACEIELNEDEPPKDYEKELEDDDGRQDTNE